ncbi:MAG: DUF1015 domain-containing protein [Syntrophomonadaceae bacterium]|jgi:uncharacterized protein (DUF1015 family)
MANIIPFRGLRYNPDKVGNLMSVVTPPYDVVDETAQAKYYAENPSNVIRLELGMVLPQDSINNNRYTRAAQYLEKWIEDDILRYEDKPALYIYQQEFLVEGHKNVRTGFICGLKVEEYTKGNIFPHEQTFSKPKADRLQLIRSTRSNFSSVFGLYSDQKMLINNILSEQMKLHQPDAELIDEFGETHKIWVITNNNIINQVVKFMAGKKIYIADGHHRYEAALEYAQEMSEQGCLGFDYVMITLFNLYDQGLVILPTHRMVANIPYLDFNTFKKHLGELFELEEISADTDFATLGPELALRGQKNHVLGMYTSEMKAYILTVKSHDQVAALLPADKSPAWKNLDVVILDNVILGQILGIGENDRYSQKNLAYSNSARVLIDQIKKQNCQLGFIVNPTPVQQLVEVAEAHDKMPQKSTYFYPKLATGLVINHLGIE